MIALIGAWGRLCSSVLVWHMSHVTSRQLSRCGVESNQRPSPQSSHGYPKPRGLLCPSGRIIELKFRIALNCIGHPNPRSRENVYFSRVAEALHAIADAGRATPASFTTTDVDVGTFLDFAPVVSMGMPGSAQDGSDRKWRQPRISSSSREQHT